VINPKGPKREVKVGNIRVEKETLSKNPTNDVLWGVNYWEKGGLGGAKGSLGGREDQTN